MEMEEPEDRGVPAWVMTFADLMSLLMCFFVLLLAFSEMDVQKFKQLSGSMKEAFGVQAQIKSDFIPKGTSVITREFSPGRPVPTSMQVMRQFTIDSSKSTLDYVSSDENLTQGEKLQDKELDRDAESLRELLREEIEQGRATVTREGGRIVVQLLEHGSFRSGDASLQPDFMPTLDKLGEVIGNMQGIVQITGHTDNVPIRTSRFRSNWELSAARAVSVAHRLLAGDNLAPQRVVVTGLADTVPMVPNDSAENRAKNRRVQINIVRTAGAGEEEPPPTGGEAASPEDFVGPPADPLDEDDTPPAADGDPTARYRS